MTNSQMGGFVLLFMASFIIFREKYSSAQLLLLNSNERLKEEISEINSEIEHLKRISETRILRKVSENLTFKELLGQTSLTTKEQWEQIANSLRIGVIKKIREESHRLGAKKQTSREEKLVLRHTTKFSNFYISPAFFVYFYSVYSLAINYEDTRPYSEYFSILSNAILIYVGSYSTQRYFKSHEQLSKTKQFLIIIILAIYIQLSIVFSQTLFWGQSDVFLVISALPWTFALLAGINFIYTVFSQESINGLVLTMTRENLTNEKSILDEHREYVENEIAKHLHGHLMLKSNSVIQSLDALDDSSDYRNSQAILDELVEGFSLQSLRSVIEFNETNTDQLQDVKAEWGSFIDIGFEGDLSTFDQMPPTQRMVVSDAIEEMIANAYRHGQAQHVTITFQKSSNKQLTLTATDDGGGLAKGYKKGFGSKIFSQASNGLFSMENMSPRGAKVTLKVSINDQVEIN
jgi:signal transduction histidine kinase